MDAFIEELNLPREPVRPFLARQIEELYGRRDGNILEMGPFSGLIFTLAQKNIGNTYSIAAFPQEMIPLCRQEAVKPRLVGGDRSHGATFFTPSYRLLF